MSEIKDGGPAFPGVEKTEYPSSIVETPYAGMTLRDYFSAKALPGVLVVCAGDTKGSASSVEDYFAGKAYSIADAMLRAREAS